MTDVGVRNGAAAPTAPPPATPQRAVRGRRTLPSSRAVVGGFLVAASAVGVFGVYTAATAAPDTVYVVAARDVAVGRRLGPADLAVVPLRLPPAQRARAFDDPAVLRGAVAIAPLARGDLVQASMVAAVAAGDVAEMSFAVEADRAVAGVVKPGERVDVLGTYGSGPSAYTSVLVSDAQVLAADAAAGPLGAPARLVITVALRDPRDALALANGVAAAQITVVRTTGRRGTAEATSYRPVPVESPAPPGGGVDGGGPDAAGGPGAAVPGRAGDGR